MRGFGAGGLTKTKIQECGRLETVPSVDKITKNELETEARGDLREQDPKP